MGSCASVKDQCIVPDTQTKICSVVVVSGASSDRGHSRADWFFAAALRCYRQRLLSQNPKKWYDSEAFLASEVNVWRIPRDKVNANTELTTKTETVPMKLDWIYHTVQVGEPDRILVASFFLTSVGYSGFYCATHKIGLKKEEKEYWLGCAPQEQFEFLRKQQETAIMLLSRWQNKNRYLIKDLLKVLGTFILYTVDPKRSHEIKLVPLEQSCYSAGGKTKTDISLKIC